MEFTPDEYNMDSGGGGNYPTSDSLTDYIKDAGIGDTLLSVASALGGGALSLAQQLTGFGGTGNDPSVGNASGSPKGIGDQINSPSLFDKAVGTLDKASTWIDKHKKLTELVMGSVGGAYAADEKRKAADKLAESRLNEQNNAARLQQEQNAAFSASVSGLRPVKRGLINQPPLTRTNGARVFNSSGKVI